MTTTRTFDATAYKDGKWWEISIPELDHVTAAKRSTEVQEYAESLAAIVLDVPVESVVVNVTFTTPPGVGQEWEAARADTTRAKELTIAAAARTKEVIVNLHASGYTLRDIEKVLGLSFQRVSQILKS